MILQPVLVEVLTNFHTYCVVGGCHSCDVPLFEFDLIPLLTVSDKNNEEKRNENRNAAKHTDNYILILAC